MFPPRSEAVSFLQTSFSAQEWSGKAMVGDFLAKKDQEENPSKLSP
jgi:hypothetical protein